jgi:hypothetical protein
MFCSKCGFHDSSLVKHLCPKCGGKLMPLPKCIHCGHDIEPQEMTCSGCGCKREAALNPFVQHDTSIWKSILDLFRGNR